MYVFGAHRFMSESHRPGAGSLKVWGGQTEKLLVSVFSLTTDRAYITCEQVMLYVSCHRCMENVLKYAFNVS